MFVRLEYQKTKDRKLSKSNLYKVLILQKTAQVQKSLKFSSEIQWVFFVLKLNQNLHSYITLCFKKF